MTTTRECFDEPQHGVPKLLREQFLYMRTSVISSAAESATELHLASLSFVSREIGQLPRHWLAEGSKSIAAEDFRKIELFDLLTEGTNRIYEHTIETSVCRKLREETLATYYELNTFATFLQIPYDMDLMERWLKASHADGIRHIGKLILCYKTSDFAIDPRNVPSDSPRKNLARNDTLRRFKAVFEASDVEMPSKRVMEVTEWDDYDEDREILF